MSSTITTPLLTASPASLGKWLLNCIFPVLNCIFPVKEKQ